MTAHEDGLEGGTSLRSVVEHLPGDDAGDRAREEFGTRRRVVERINWRFAAKTDAQTRFRGFRFAEGLERMGSAVELPRLRHEPRERGGDARMIAVFVERMGGDAELKAHVALEGNHRRDGEEIRKGELERQAHVGTSRGGL